LRPKLSKQLLSFFSDQLIESTSSEYNEELYLLYTKGRYQLVTDKVIYSYEDRYDNFVAAFIHIDLEAIKNVLILGYGLGSIPHIAEKVYNKTFSYTAIEIDPEIIRLALKYTMPELKSTIDLIESDAFTYMKYEEALYDLICFDVFLNDIIPSKFLSQSFLEKLNLRLTEAGVLVINMLYHTDQDRISTNEYVNTVFTKVFTVHKTVFVRNNLMIFGWKRNRGIV